MHFYFPNGTLFSTEKELPDTRPSDAIKQCLDGGLVPSMTTLLSIVHYPHITRWKQKVSLEHFVKNKNFNQALDFQDNTSSDLGTKLHDACEEYLLDGFKIPKYLTPNEIALLQPFFDWAPSEIDEIIFTEKSFADKELGFAGTADLGYISKPRSNGKRDTVLGDYKFKKHSDKFPIKSTIEYCCQLSGYEKHYSKEYGPMVRKNIMLNSGLGWSKNPYMKIFTYEKDYYPTLEYFKSLWYEVNAADYTDVPYKEFK